MSWLALWLGLSLSVVLLCSRHGLVALVAAQLSLSALAGLLVGHGFFASRALARRRCGDLAFQKIGLGAHWPGLMIGAGTIAGPAIADGRSVLPSWLAIVGAVYLLATVVAIEHRGVELFWDFELRSFAWCVFPERGRLVTGGIFAWMAHPVYSSLLRCVLLLTLTRNTTGAYVAGLVALLPVLGLTILEERDLRRSPEYVAYRRGVPAFWVLRLLAFWRFLLRGDGSPRPGGRESHRAAEEGVAGD